MSKTNQLTNQTLVDYVSLASRHGSFHLDLHNIEYFPIILDLSFLPKIDSRNLRDANSTERSESWQEFMCTNSLAKDDSVSLNHPSTFSLSWVVPSKETLLKHSIVKWTRGIYAIRTVPREVNLDKNSYELTPLPKTIQSLWIILPPSVFHGLLLPKIFSWCKV